MDKIVEILTGCISVIIAAIVPLLVAEDKKVKLPYVWFILIVMIAIVAFLLIYLQKKANKQLEQLKDENKKLNCRLTNLSSIKQEDYEEEGTQYLLMALCQNYDEPQRLIYLKKAKDKGNLLAALLLANDYKTGIKHANGEWLLEPDRSEAFNIYKSMVDMDQSGVCAWELGWMYQWGLGDTNKIDEKTRGEIAWKYYKQAAGEDKTNESTPSPHFVKAYNSLGNFLWEGWGSQPQNIDKAKEYFSIAAKRGDIYAKVNFAIASKTTFMLDAKKNPVYLDIAKKYLEEAAVYKNSQAYVELGILNEIYADIEQEDSKKKDRYQEAARNYLSAIRLIKNQYAAAAYFKLGNLIQQHKTELPLDEIMEELGNSDDDSTVTCFVQAYNLFRETINRGVGVDNNYMDYYKELVKRFNKISA